MASDRSFAALIAIDWLFKVVALDKIATRLVEKGVSTGSPVGSGALVTSVLAETRHASDHWLMLSIS